VKKNTAAVSLNWWAPMGNRIFWILLFNNDVKVLRKSKIVPVAGEWLESQ
jgi:hypothetical protein